MIQSQIKALLMHRTLGILLAYWNCYAYVLIVVVFTLVGRLLPGSDLLVCLYSCGWLLLAITFITAYLITSNGCAAR